MRRITVIHGQPPANRLVKLFLGSMAGVCMSVFIAGVVVTISLVMGYGGNRLVAAMPDAGKSTSIARKKVGDYRKDLKTFVKQSKSKDEVVRFGAVLNLCMLHSQLVEDERYELNSQLQSFRAIAADRLKKCRKELKLQMLRYDRAKKREPERPAKISEGSDEIRFKLTEKVIAQDMHLSSSLLGGPLNLWQYVGNPAGPVCDYGPDLVNLIENTINPEFWRRNGGNGIIEYYQPLRIIVVGASSRVHNDITSLLNTLRKNGR